MKRVILIDNYDSFTYNLVHYLEQVGLETIVHRVDQIEIELLIKLDFDAIIISPGPGEPADYPLLYEILEEFSGCCPILGICLGHQAIGEYYGHELLRAENPMHGKKDVCSLVEHGLFEGIGKEMEVMRYHSLLLKKNKYSPLKVLGESSKAELMIVEHESMAIVGIQFHPESIFTPLGMKLLANWKLYCEQGLTKTEIS